LKTREIYKRNSEEKQEPIINPEREQETNEEEQQNVQR